jgi:hypothetical protein
MRAVKKFILILWCLASLGWMVYTAELCKMPDAFRTYRTYYRMVADIQNGEATGYEKKDYLSYGPYLEAAGADFALFLFLATGFPGLALSCGTWLLRERKPVKKPAAKNRRRK